MFDFNGTGGAGPGCTLTLIGGNFYGMIEVGGAHDSGCIFSVDTNGSNYTDMFDFNGTNGEIPDNSLAFSGNVLYGMTDAGGSYNKGTVFSFTEIGLRINKITTYSGAINIYPNPNNGIFTIALSYPELGSGSETIEVYNIFGEQVYVGMLKPVQHDYEINIGTQPSGVYLYRVISETGNLIGEGKVIVEH